MSRRAVLPRVLLSSTVVVAVDLSPPEVNLVSVELGARREAGELKGDTMHHHVTASLYPNWVGTRQVRHARLSDGGDTLELWTDPFTLAGRRSVQRLTWSRFRRA